jgi:DNA-binding MarR family transcriptional regulator
VSDRVLRGAITLELWTAARYGDEVSGRRLRAVGVEPSEYGFLSVVGSLQPVTRTGIAKATGLRRTTVRDAVGRLIERGQVVESADARDARATLLTLTPAGQELFERGVVEFRKFLASLDDALDGQLDELEQAVRTVRVALEQMADGS